MGLIDILIVSIFGLAVITSQMPSKKEKPQDPPVREITAEEIMHSISLDRIQIKRILIEAELSNKGNSES